MAQQSRHAARPIAKCAAFAVALGTVLHFGLQILAGIQQCDAWETCPW